MYPVIGSDFSKLILESDDSNEMGVIIRGVMPDWATRFNVKHREYGEAVDNEWELGPKAAYVDMARKMRKVKRALWDGEEEVLKSEPLDEILEDLISHCFLILAARRGDQS